MDDPICVIIDHLFYCAKSFNCKMHLHLHITVIKMCKHCFDMVYISFAIWEYAPFWLRTLCENFRSQLVIECTSRTYIIHVGMYDNCCYLLLSGHSKMYCFND